MASHKISLTVPTIEVENTDILVDVFSDGAKLGTLKISKGTVDWLPSHHSVNFFEMTWERFAQIMEEHGTKQRSV